MCGAGNSKKKLLFVITNLSGGGAERVLVNLINHLDRNKYDILLVIFDNILDLQADLYSYVKIVCLDKKSRWDFFKLIFKLKKIICDYRPNAVISFLHYTNIVVVLSSLFLRRKYTLILSEHDYHRKYLAKIRIGHIKRWLMKFAYRRADRIIAVSKRIAQELEEDFNLQSVKIKTIYNPVLLEVIREKSQEEVEHPFFKDKNAQVIISVGRLVESKRFDILLRAFFLVRKKQKKIRLIILGKGKLRKDLEILASQLNISKWIDFVGFQSNAFAWISKANIFVLSSDYEGLPMVILEAMACGVPVISTDCSSGPGEIISNGKNGILVPVANEEALANAILDLLLDEEKRKRFAEEAKKRVQDFDIEKIAEQYFKLFKENI